MHADHLETERARDFKDVKDSLQTLGVVVLCAAIVWGAMKWLPVRHECLNDPQFYTHAMECPK